MEKRIIFFVDNSHDRTRGLFHCFGQSTQIINEFCRMYLFTPDGEFSLTPIITTNNECLFISEKEVRACPLEEGKQSPLDGWKILLIHDSVTMENAEKFFSKDTFIVYHTRPQDAKTWLGQNNNRSKFCDSIKSVHEKRGKYPLIYKITEIFNNNGNPFNKNEFNRVFEEIISSLFNSKLDSILELLHLLLVGNKPTEENGIIDKLKNEGIDLNNNILYDLLNDTPMNQIESFIKFRDDILKDI